jgi:hypothetical protein
MSMMARQESVPNGKVTTTKGHDIRLSDHQNHPDPTIALKSILGTLDGATDCKFVTMVPLNDPRVDAAVQQHSLLKMEAAYAGKPLSTLSAQRRARVLKTLAHKVTVTSSST